MSDDLQRKIVIRPEDLTRVSASVPLPSPTAPQQSALVPPEPVVAKGQVRRLVPFALILAGLVPVSAVTIVWALTRESRDGQSRQVRAVERVGRIDKQLGAETMQAVPASAGPSRLAQAIDAYCARAVKQDFTDCPADFVVAYRQHVRAWADVREALGRLPDNMLEGLFMGFFNAILRGEADGGANRMEASVAKACNGVRSSWEDVERIAAKYGVVID